MNIYLRAARTLQIARDITLKGHATAEFFGNTENRLDWYDNRAADLVKLIFDDLGIPEGEINPGLKGMIQTYLDGDGDYMEDILHHLRLHHEEIENANTTGSGS